MYPRRTAPPAVTPPRCGDQTPAESAGSEAAEPASAESEPTTTDVPAWCAASPRPGAVSAEPAHLPLTYEGHARDDQRAEINLGPITREGGDKEWRVVSEYSIKTCRAASL